MTLEDFVPLLLRPRYYGAVNRWRRGRKALTYIFRDLFLLVFGGFIFYAIYRGTYLGLRRTSDFSDFAYLPPSTPLSVLLLFLFAMLILSSAVMALGTFFLSQDNQLILATPVSRSKYFFSKLTSVFLSTAWMPLSFLFPFLLAFGAHYHGDIYFYLSWIAVLVPYFAIPVALAFLLSLIVITIVPPSQTRILLGLVVLFLFFFLLKAGFIIRDGIVSGSNVGELFRILTVLSFPDALWLPSHWAALVFDEILEKNYTRALPPLFLLWVTAFGLFALAYGMFSLLFPQALSRSTNRRRLLPEWLKLFPNTSFLNRMPIPSPALMIKDYKVLFRDMPQIIQLLLLMMIYLVYLYNLRVFGLIDALEDKERASWLAFFFITNASMGAFVTTATATRLVFPSISLEGRSFWVLLTAPITIRDVIRNKFWTWFIPIGLLSSITFTAGNIALGTSIYIVIATFIVGWFLSAGLISLGLAVGAMFARYDWEHSAQLVASFGSFVFMLSSIMLITINMVPLGIALYMREQGMVGEGMNNESWAIILGACGIFILLVNTLVVELSFELAQRAVKKHMKED